MAQQIQFVYLSQSEYDVLASKPSSRLYFTADTHRIYKGSDLYATQTFDQIEIEELQASTITVNGSSVSLEGHVHQIADVSGLGTTISGFVDVLQGVHGSSIYKETGTFDNLVVTSTATFSATMVSADAVVVNGSVSASTGTFDNLVVTGDVTMSLSQVQFGSIVASEILVNGSSVALEGHGHSTSDVSGLDSLLSGYASISHSHVMADVSGLSPLLSGITESSVTKNLVSANTGTFGSISADSATFSSIMVQVADFTTTTVSA